ncbi:hypothetical protein [Effusibacillus consociatus]|uniref:Uncharacterized protein n=1 Tax=Effusibacillus consociatus TaxID=1117041 RepID=A0ABV9Q6X3_9BACL
MKKWTKLALLTTPLVFVTSVYAFANERSESQASVQIQEVKPAETVVSEPNAATSSEIPNPFVVNKDQIQQQLSVTEEPTSSALTIESIKKLHIKAKTDRGELKLEYHLEGNGTPRLNGEIGTVKVHISGDKAKELMNQLLNRWDLFGVLQQTLANPNGKLNDPAIFALEEFEIEMVDGKEIELDENKLEFEAKAVQPVKTEVKIQVEKEDQEEKEKKEKHEDNGKHKGQEKQENKDKKNEKHDDDDKKDKGEDD